MLSIFLIGLFVAVSSSALGLLVAKNHNFFKPYLPFLVAVGGGLLIGITLVEFLPRIYENPTALTGILIFAGFLAIKGSEDHLAPLIFGKEASTECHHHHETPDHKHLISHHAACTSIGCILICAFFDGIEITAGFMMDKSIGILVTLGFLVHTIAESSLVVSIGLSGGFNKATSYKNAILVGVAIFSGTLVSLFAANFLNFDTYILPVVTGVMLYVSFGHLVPASLQDKHGFLGVSLGACFIFLMH
jgi:zinc transporter ZupT